MPRRVGPQPRPSLPGYGRSLASRVSSDSWLPARGGSVCAGVCLCASSRALFTPATHSSSFLVSSHAEVPLSLWALGLPSVASGGASSPPCLAGLHPAACSCTVAWPPMLVSGFRCECWGGARMGQPGLSLGRGPSSRSLGGHPAFQEQVTAAVAHALEQQMQKLLEETQLDMNEFDNLLQPIIDTCTKDAISVRMGRGVGRTPEPGAPDEVGAPTACLGPGYFLAPRFSLRFLPEHFRGLSRQERRKAVEPLGSTPRRPHALRPGEASPGFTRCPGCCRPGRTDVQQRQVPPALRTGWRATPQPHHGRWGHF